MKKRWLAVSLILGGIFLFSCFGAVVSFALSGPQIKTEAVLQEKAVPLGETDTISIHSRLASCRLAEAEGDSQEVTAVLSGKGSKRVDLEVIREGNAVSIEVKTKRWWLFHFDFWSNYQLVVTLPKTFAGELSVKNSAGETAVEIPTLSLADASFDSSAGKIVLGNLTAKSLSVKNSAGETLGGTLTCTERAVLQNSAGSIRIGSLTVEQGSAEITCSAGAIQLDGLRAVEASVNNSAGKTTLNHVANTGLTVKQSAGDLVCQYDQMENDITLRSSAGRITLTLPERSAFQLDASASAGKVTCGFPILSEEHTANRLRGTVGGGGHTVQIKSSGGDVVIQKAK